MNPQEHIRDTVCRVARSLVGFSANPSSNRQAYLDLVAPGEAPHRQTEMGDMSGCALTVAGIWRASGLNHYSLAAPYRDQTAVSRLYELSRLAGALRSYYPGSKPQPGDVVWVGHGPTEHVYTCLEVQGDIILGVDGGQKDEHGFQIVLVKEHRWSSLQEQSRVPEGSWGAPRSINGFWDISNIQTHILYG